MRSAIVDCATRLWQRGLVTGSSGNISARMKDGDLLVTPSGRSLERLSENDIVRVDRSGRPRDTAGRPSSELPLHLAAYRVRADAAFLVHTHPTACVIWSKRGRLFARDTVGAIETLGAVGWVPYAAAGSRELADSAAEIFARGVDTILMERHGLSVLAASMERAFILTDLAEESARIAIGTEGAAPAESSEQGKPCLEDEERGMPPYRVIF
ncbi:MAG: class II aldolase/adducin family protein [Candidatus Eremiobacteraeota bacterium]|nr:class II aldolase/adducin family protein [Candidatus Eremiobacteraeota bacterium]